jgi:hypothetical protein
MAQYLLSIYQPEGDPPPPEVLDPMMAELDALNGRMREAGVWVFAAGLHPPHTATVVSQGGALLTDGPFAEGREHLGGFTIVECADLDEALEWGKRLAAVLAPLSIEVRPFA